MQEKQANAWKTGTQKNAGRPLYNGLGSQFMLLLKKVHSHEAGIHRSRPINERTRRQVLTIFKEIIVFRTSKVNMKNNK